MSQFNAANVLAVCSITTIEKRLESEDSVFCTIRQEQILGSECTLRTQEEQEECSQVAKQLDYHFNTIHDGQYLAISWTAVRFKGICILTN